jgi:hypothetical protein
MASLENGGITSPSWSDDPVADRITISPAGGITLFSEKFQIDLKLIPEISGEGRIVWYCSGTPASLFQNSGCSKRRTNPCLNQINRQIGLRFFRRK